MSNFLGAPVGSRAVLAWAFFPLTLAGKTDLATFPNYYILNYNITLPIPIMTEIPILKGSHILAGPNPKLATYSDFYFPKQYLESIKNYVAPSYHKNNYI